MSAIQASNSNQILFSLLYCITTTKAFDDMPPLCASAAVLTLCHFNGALCQFGSYGWHWLYNTLCVIIQKLFDFQTSNSIDSIKNVYSKTCQKRLFHVGKFVYDLISLCFVISTTNIKQKLNTYLNKISYLSTEFIPGSYPGTYIHSTI